MSLQRLNPATLPPPEPGVHSQIVGFPSGVGYRFSGFTALDALGELVGEGDLEAQITQSYANATEALRCVGATWDNVTHLMVYAVDVEQYASLEHSLVEPLFIGGPPASTVVEVSRLIDPRWLVEVQVDAVVSA